MVDTRPVAKTTTTLADGRSLFYFDDRARTGSSRRGHPRSGGVFQ